MTDAGNTTNSRIDIDRHTAARDASQSTGWRETAYQMHASAGADHEACDASGCDRDGTPIRAVDGNTDNVRRESVRCPDHKKRFLEVSS